MSIRPLLGEGHIRACEDMTEPLQTASWFDSAIIFESRRWTCREVEMRWTAPHHLIVLTDAGKTSMTRIQSGGEALFDGRDRPGAVSFVPAGVERNGVYRDAHLSYSALWLDPKLAIAGGERLAKLRILANRRDTVIAALLDSLRAEMALGQRPDAAYVEHLVALLAFRLATLDGTPGSQSRHGRLGGGTLARVRDYVASNLASDISLSDMAAVAGMSADSFARRFKATTGLAPYAYVLEQRIRCAEELLGESDMAIGAIAARLGFSSQSHFTTTFRRFRGLTPQNYRMQVLPGS